MILNTTLQLVDKPQPLLAKRQWQPSLPVPGYPTHDTSSVRGRSRPGLKQQQGFDTFLLLLYEPYQLRVGDSSFGHSQSQNIALQYKKDPIAASLRDNGFNFIISHKSYSIKFLLKFHSTATTCLSYRISFSPYNRSEMIPSSPQRFTSILD